MIGDRNSAWCDCGVRKSKGAAACAQCRYLDGERPIQSEVIAALRGTDGLSATELCVAVYGYSAHDRLTAMLRTVKVLVESGRLRRYRAPVDTVARARSGGDCWMYALYGAGHSAAYATDDTESHAPDVRRSA